MKNPVKENVPLAASRRDFLKHTAALAGLLALDALPLRAAAGEEFPQTARSAKGKPPRTLLKLLDVPKPAIGKHALQSVAVRDGTFYAFHNHSIVQEFSGGKLTAEYKLASGSLVHPNDAHFYKDTLWICDTSDGPSLKRVDLARRSVVEAINLNKHGWRTSAVTIASDTTLLCCQVEAVPPENRSRFLVLEYDYAAKKNLRVWKFPLDMRYVQGCALEGARLHVTTNSGGHSPCSKFITLDLEKNAIADIQAFDEFGESEGLHLWHDGSQPNLITGKAKSGILRIPLG
ncbi:MAG: twin-arginine translocation signal domain-containing protein [Opitutaceae bacterium]|jgi:hypothetical protein|nr:twin-arginine translocation signal domain-containing protein [Opitutaceae bacterium]